MKKRAGTDMNCNDQTLQVTKELIPAADRGMVFGGGWGGGIPHWSASAVMSTGK